MSDEVTYEQDVGRTRRVVELMVSMIEITACVHLKEDCAACWVKAIIPKFNSLIGDQVESGFVWPWKGLLMANPDDPDSVYIIDDAQYLRQCLIWAKEQAEERAKKPCTADRLATTLKGMMLI